MYKLQVLHKCSPFAESIESIEVTDDERNNILNYFGDFVREKRYRQLMAVLRSAEEKIGNYDEM